jgi:hypothetical protein
VEGREKGEDERPTRLGTIDSSNNLGVDVRLHFEYFVSGQDCCLNSVLESVFSKFLESFPINLLEAWKESEGREVGRPGCKEAGKQETGVRGIVEELIYLHFLLVKSKHKGATSAVTKMKLLIQLRKHRTTSAGQFRLQRPVPFVVPCTSAHPQKFHYLRARYHCSLWKPLGQRPQLSL